MSEGSPLERRRARIAVSPMLRALPPGSHWLLRGGAPVRAAAGAALGFALPEIACRSRSHGTLSALWLGPDEQWLVAPGHEGERLGRTLAQALEGLAHALVDASHRHVDIEMQGPAAAACLNVGCPLDLDPGAFPVGMCTRTVMAKAQIVLWRPEERTFRVLVARSYADYVSRFLAEAARELL